MNIYVPYLSRKEKVLFSNLNMRPKMSLYFWEKEKSFANRGVKTASISPYSKEIKNIFTFHGTYVP